MRIKPVEPVYGIKLMPARKKLVEQLVQEVKEIQEYQKSTGHKIDIRV